MHYLQFAQDQIRYPICFLVPTIKQDEIRKAYVDPFDLETNELLVLDLHYDEGTKNTSVKTMRRYIEEELQPVFEEMGVEYLVVADAKYFTTLTKAQNVDRNLGYVLDSAFGPQKVIYVPNFRAIFYDPDGVKAKIARGIEALKAHRAESYIPPGHDIIKFAAYPQTYDEIKQWLDDLLAAERPLTIDIEGFDLKHHKSGIGTISFSWDKGEGIAFPVDYVPIEGAIEAPFGRQVHNEPVRELLREFFRAFRQKAIYHHIAYDAYVLIYQLFMKDILDTEGLLEGMEILLRDWDCTKLIAYLATNSCAGNKLSLKDLAQAFAGNYGLGGDITDITKIPLPKLLEYNLVDALSTWFVYDKHRPVMLADQQEEIYETVFKPATLDIVQMQLTGLPINMERVKEVKAILERERDTATAQLQASPLVQKFTHKLNEKWVEAKNLKLKKKRVTLADAKEVFNPGSSNQLQELIYGMLELPVIAFTDTRQPSTKAEVFKDLENHTEDPEILALLRALQDLSTVAILLETFIPAFERAVLGPDGWHYLFGNFNLGGTLSARLSSSDPNLQNIPAGAAGEKTKKGLYGKLIKSCVEAPLGWIFSGLDFNSLEDKISGLTTKDPNKLKVYMGHTVFALEIDGVVHHIRDDTTIVYDGRSYTGEEFYATYSKV